MGSEDGFREGKHLAGKLKPLDVERETRPGKYADGDGLSNFEEYKLGTNPLDAKDSLRVHASSNGRGVKVRFHGGAVRGEQRTADSSLCS